MSSTDLVPAGRWDSEQLEIVRNSVAPGCSDDELVFFAKVCEHKGLDPFAGEIVAIPRWDSRAGRNVLVIQETVAGLRALAERSGLYNGQDPPAWCGPDARWVEVWLDTKTAPAACKVAVYRKGWDRPTVGIARFSSYVQLDKQGNPTGLWKTGPDFMLWKCAEAAALKRAFKHAIAEAGISTRELSTPSRISMEAREVGLDDDGRHALVAEITDGRTESTRDLTEDEALEVRAELARLRAEAGVDPETGVIDEPPKPASTARPANTGGVSPQCGASQHTTCPGYYKTAHPCGCYCHQKPAEPDAVARAIARGAGDLVRRLETLSAAQVDSLKDWRRRFGLAKPVPSMTTDEQARMTAELDRRDRDGWPIKTAEPTEDTATAEVVDTLPLDDYSDEPF